MKRTSQRFYVYLFAIVLSLASSCARKPDDAKISGDIQSKFSQDSGLSGKQLTVQANNGVVTLGGTVDNDAQRDAASRQAASVAGVKEVVNNLQVGNPPAAVAAPTATPAPTIAQSEKGMTGVRRKGRKARASEDSNTANNSANDSSSTNPDNQSASNAAPPISDVPPNNAAVVVQTTPPPPPAPKRLIIDQGTQLAVRLIDPIDSEKNQTGDTFHATLNAPLTSDGEQAVPAGTELTGHLVDVKSAGKFAGQSVVVLQLDSLSSGGKTYSLQTDQYRKEGKSRGKNTAEKVGGGAILGGIIGAIAGGGKGAAIGTAAGAGVGAGAQEVSKSQQIKLPSETVLNFTLQAPVTVVQAASPDANRPKLGDSPQ
ncbi:MAG: BON domain-containing protein [Candidatus Sulfotelmatobacter sp.]